MAHASGVHPLPAYLELCRAVGQLAIFGAARRPPDLPRYDHDDLGTCFLRVRDHLNDLINIIVEPQYALNDAKTDYISTIAPNTMKTKLPHPMPIAMTFFAGQGEEPTLIRIGTAYESATGHRTPPPAFGPVDGQSGRTTSPR